MRWVWMQRECRDCRTERLTTLGAICARGNPRQEDCAWRGCAGRTCLRRDKLPPQQPLDQHKHTKRCCQQDRRQGQRDIHVQLETNVDRQRHGLRATWKVAGEDNRRAKFAQGPRPGHHRAAEERRPRQRRGDVAKDLPTAGAVEGSNVSPIEAMVRMLDQTRSFETQIRIIKESRGLDESGSSMLRAR